MEFISIVPRHELWYNSVVEEVIFMDLKICGLVDIILVLVGLIFLFVGFKKGFITKVLSLVGILAILVFGFLYCGQFADFLISKDIFYSSLKAKFAANINLPDGSTATEVIKQATGLPDFIAGLLAKSISDPSEAVDVICGQIAGICMRVIAFGIIVVGAILILIILKVIAKAIRTSAFIRVVDGIFGMVLYAAIYLAIVTVLFAGLHLVWEANFFSSAREWLTVDFALEKEGFRISKSLFNQNFLVKIISLFK